MENYKDISKRITDHLIASDKSFLYSHQISSFNHFISELIPNVVENYGPIKLYGNYNEDAQKYENLIEISFSNDILMGLVFGILFAHMMCTAGWREYNKKLLS